MPASNPVSGQPAVMADPMRQADNGQPRTADDASTANPRVVKPQGIAAPTDPNAQGEVRSTFRGPLRYEVETSSPSLEAGKIFSIILRITNPYDVPVVIRLVGFALPVEFDDETDHQESRGLVMPWRRRRTGPVKDGTTGAGITKDGGSTTGRCPRCRCTRCSPARAT